MCVMNEKMDLIDTKIHTLEGPLRQVPVHAEELQQGPVNFRHKSWKL